MKYECRDSELERLAIEPSFNAGFAAEVVKAYRKRVQQIHAATDERDLLALRSLRFKKLKGKRSHQYSIRLNLQWRLIFEIESSDSGNVIHLVGIEDYH